MQNYIPYLPDCETYPAEPRQVLDLDTVIHRHIHLVLEMNHGNKLKTARQLGISRSTLYRILDSETVQG